MDDDRIAEYRMETTRGGDQEEEMMKKKTHVFPLRRTRERAKGERGDLLCLRSESEKNLGSALPASAAALGTTPLARPRSLLLLATSSSTTTTTYNYIQHHLVCCGPPVPCLLLQGNVSLHGTNANRDLFGSADMTCKQAGSFRLRPS